MGAEKDLQKWFVDQAKKCALASSIQGIDECDIFRNDVRPPVEASLDLTDPLTDKAIKNIGVVLDSLAEAEIVLADSDLALVPGVRFKPDLLLHNRETGAWIILELKVSANAARQTITELLAYTEGLQRKLPNAPVHLAIASQSWRPLLEYAAVAQVRSAKYPLLPLIVKPVEGASDAKPGYYLKIHWGLLKFEKNATVIPPYAIVCDTKSFFFRSEKCWAWHNIQLIDQIIVDKARALTLQADPERIGFILVWKTFANGPVWHATTCLVNPARLENTVPSNSPVHQYLNPDVNPDWPDTPEPSGIDYGWKLLQRLDIEGFDLDTELSAFDNWTFAQMILSRQYTSFVFAAGWGRMQNLFTGACRPPESPDASNLDLQRFDGHHPFNWIPRLDQLTGSDFCAEDLSRLDELYKLGAIFGAVAHYYKHRPVELEDADDFGYLIAKARLISAWPYVFRSLSPTHHKFRRPIQLKFECPDGTQLVPYNIDRLLIWCKEWLCAPTKWHRFVFELGFERAFAERLPTSRETQHVPNMLLNSMAEDLVGWALKAPEVQDHAISRGVLDHALDILGDQKQIATLALASRELCNCLVELADVAASLISNERIACAMRAPL